MHTKIKIIINTILIGILGLSIFKMGLKIFDYKKAIGLHDEINEIYKDSSPLDSHSKMKKLNQDYKFWLKIENTNIDYPVVQSNDNSFYLKKDFYKNESSSGSIFLDYRNSYNTDFNNFIYGHNMKNKTVFHNVEKYKEADFFNQKNKIFITDDKYQYIYEAFSVYVDDNIGSKNYTNINLLSDDFKIKEYINDIQKKTLHSSSLEISPSDKIITLVTCSYEDSDVRTILHAKLIDTKEIK